jgi:hypothetical protein
MRCSDEWFLNCEIRGVSVSVGRAAIVPKRVLLLPPLGM